jgi:hypothetical protein
MWRGDRSTYPTTNRGVALRTALAFAVAIVVLDLVLLIAFRAPWPWLVLVALASMPTAALTYRRNRW